MTPDEKTAMDEMKQQVKEIHDMLLIGNGKPGVLTRLATIEQSQEALLRGIWIAVTAAVGHIAVVLFKKAGG